MKWVDQPLVTRTVYAHWALAAAGLGDLIWGHASIRHPTGEGVVMKASGWGFEEVDDTRIVMVGWDGARLDGTGTVHMESAIHTSVMKARPDVMCVVHTHAPAVSAFAALEVPLRPISHDAVPFAQQLPRFELTGDLIRTPELGEALADTLGDAPAAIMLNHGLVTAGPDPAAAVMYAMLLERACQTQLVAMGAGTLRSWSGSEEVQAKLASAWSSDQFNRGFDYLTRKGAAIHRLSCKSPATGSCSDH